MDAKNNKGFTLVELLVVISIIALLLSILMPSLSRARNQAKSVVCRVNLHQWGQIFFMYTNDNNGNFYIQPPPPDTKLWMRVLRPYYPPNQGFCCPTATKTGGKGTFAAWGPFSGDWATEPGEWIHGSYGTNDWLVNTSEPTNNYWRTNNVKGGNNVPLMLDCMWVDGYPTDKDVPARHEGQWNSGTVNAMQQFCINRHNGTINSVFMDFSTRKVKLKELWKLKWSRNFNTAKPDPDWSISPWLNKIN